MQTQRFLIAGRVVGADAPDLQERLGVVHGQRGRPLCLCRHPGVPMYVARHGAFRVKRMPGSGGLHDADCQAFEVGTAGADAPIDRLYSAPSPQCQRLALADVDPLLRIQLLHTSEPGPSSASVRHGASSPATGPTVAPWRMVHLNELARWLFVRAGFNRWSPAMRGRRVQFVVAKHLMEAARGIELPHGSLQELLYVPGPYDWRQRERIAHERQARLRALSEGSGRVRSIVVLGEVRSVVSGAKGALVVLRHMPDAPLWASAARWSLLAQRNATLLNLLGSDSRFPVRLVMAAWVHVRSDGYLKLESAGFLPASQHWIPVGSMGDLPLIDALVEQGRQFVVPSFADGLRPSVPVRARLLDTQPRGFELRLADAVPDAGDRSGRPVRAQHGYASPVARWIWYAGGEMPELPPVKPAFEARVVDPARISAPRSPQGGASDGRRP